MGHAGSGAQALVRNRADSGEHVLDPVMQFRVDQILQFVGSVAFFSVDA